MKIGRTLPPAAAPIPFVSIFRALPACFDDSSLDDQLEEEITREFKSSHCFLLSSGKAALTIILKALKDLCPERDEVIIPAYTCYSVPAAIKRAGLKIKLCDMAASSLDIDISQLSEIIHSDKNNKKILCVLVTHLFGCPADYSAIREIVREDIPIIEDAAQAMGEEIAGQKLGTIGDVGFFSLGRGKALSAIEGGIIVTKRKDIGEAIAPHVHSLNGYSRGAALKLGVKAILISLLQKPFVFWLPKALPFLRLGETIYERDFSILKISNFQRKLARNWQKRLNTHRKCRMKNLSIWQEEMPKTVVAPGSMNLQTSFIRLPLFAQSLKVKDRFIEYSEKNGMGLMSTYPTPINEIPEIKHEFNGRHYPRAKDISERLFTVPIHELVSNIDIVKTINLLSKNGNYITE